MTENFYSAIIKIILSLAFIVFLYIKILLKYSDKKEKKSEKPIIRKTFNKNMVQNIIIIFLTIMAIFSFSAFFNFFDFHGNGQVIHWWEMYHYYINAKYFKELGYYDLYNATVIADSENQQKVTDKTKIMDLHSYQHIPKDEVLKMKDRIKSNFSEKRWEQFKKDVFEIVKHDPRYPGMLDDHGYNATPIWTVIGQFIANMIPVDKIILVALIDIFLLIVMFCFIYYAFGTEMLLASVIFFGNNFCSTWLFIGGSMLRFDWFVCLIIGISMLQKNKYMASGSLIAYASLIRIFPVLFGFFLGIKMIIETIKDKKIPVRYIKFFGGFAVTIILFLLLTLTLGNPANIYKNYSSKIRMHNNLVQANGIGLRLVLISDKTDLNWDKFIKKYTDINPLKNPFMNWVEAKEKINKQRKPLLYSIIILSIIILSLIIYKRDDLEASAFAVILLYIALIPAQYYYCFLLALFIILYKRDLDFKNFILISLLILISIISYIIDIKEVFYLKMFVLISYLYLIYVIIFITYEFYSEYHQLIKSKFFRKNKN